MKINTDFDLYCWLKLYFWRFSQAGWTKIEAVKSWGGDPFVAYHENCLSKAKLCDIISEELWANGFRQVDGGEEEEHF